MKSLLLASTLLLGTLLPVSAMAEPAPAAEAVPASSQVTVVLVHGAWADGSSWSKVIPLLQAKGIKVLGVQNPLTSLADDVVATKRVLADATGPVILVGHSWAGTVITRLAPIPRSRRSST
jgi:pimeloyl-ACP methyl ester carboxylesterase